MDRVGAGDQRRVQDGRHLRDHLEADEDGQHEVGKQDDKMLVHQRASD